MNAETIHFCQSVVFLKGMKFMSQGHFSINQTITQAVYDNSSKILLSDNQNVPHIKKPVSEKQAYPMAIQ